MMIIYIIYFLLLMIVIAISNKYYNISLLLVLTPASYYKASYITSFLLDSTAIPITCLKFLVFKDYSNI